MTGSDLEEGEVPEGDGVDHPVGEGLWGRVFSEPKWKSGQLKSRRNRGKIGTIYNKNRSISGQKTSQVMFYFSF